MTGKDALVGPWVAERSGGTWTPGGAVTIGLFDEDKGLLAGVIYENWNYANIFMHVAAVDGARWLTREFAWFVAYYPFNQLGCKRVSGLTPSSNARARKFNEALGFKQEAILKDAAPDGDLILYYMRREDCRWLKLKDKPHGKI